MSLGTLTLLYWQDEILTNILINITATNLNKRNKKCANPCPSTLFQSIFCIDRTRFPSFIFIKFISGLF